MKFVPEEARLKAEAFAIETLGAIVATALTEEWLSRACFNLKPKRGRRPKNKTGIPEASPS